MSELMNDRIPYVYICSAGHSGSTLLDLLLGSHSQVESLGELVHLSKNLSLNTLCSCGVPIRSCNRWRQVVAILNEKLDIDAFKDPYALHVGFPSPQVIKDKIHDTLSYKVRRKYLRAILYLRLKYDLGYLSLFLNPIYEGIENTIEVYEAVKKTVPCQTVIDSSKSYLEAIEIYRKSPRMTRILLLSRDGRAVLYSYRKRNFPRAQSVSAWKNHYKRALALFRKFLDANDVLHVKYEDLVEDPRKELKRICCFLGMEFEEAMLNFTQHVHHIANGNNMRFSKSSEIRADNAWQRNLSKEDHAFFRLNAGDLNHRLGYYE